MNISELFWWHIFSFPRIRKVALTDPNFKKKCAYLALKIYLAWFVGWIYQFLTTPFKIIPQDFQWILGLLTPLPKMLFIKLFLTICFKAYGSIIHSVKVTVVHNFQIQHALFLVLTLGFTATEVTSYVILCIDFLLNIYDALKILHKSKKEYSVEEGRSNIKCKYFTIW